MVLVDSPFSVDVQQDIRQSAEKLVNYDPTYTVLDYSLLSALWILSDGTEKAYPKVSVARLVGVARFGQHRVNTFYDLEQIGLLRLLYREDDQRVYLALTASGLQMFANHVERSREY